MISYLFVALMMVIGGVIGFVADSLGHRIGKKRLTFMGLRPRHTATLITVLAGVLIPLITVVTVAVLSSDVRTWLLRGQQAISDAKSLEGEVTDLEAQQKTIAKEVQEKAALGEKLDAKLKAKEVQVLSLEAEEKRTSEAARAATEKAAKLTAKLSRIGAQLLAKEKELGTAKGELGKKREQLRKLEASFNEAAKQLNEEYAQYNKQQDEIQKQSDELTRLKGDVDQLKQAKDKADQDLNEAKENFHKTIDALTKTEAELNAGIVESANELNQKQAQVKVLDAYINNQFNVVRTQPLTFSKGEEMARVQLLPERTSPEVSAAVEELIRSARVAAGAKGAKPSGVHQSAEILPGSIGGRPTSAAEEEEAIVKELTGRNRSYVLVASSSFNAFMGEPVFLSVDAEENPLVYHAGDVIAEVPIDGRKSDEEVVTAIFEFIKGKVSTNAKSAGMLPVQGREDGLGSVPTVDVLALLREIRSSGQRVRLRAEAAQDTRRADSLKLRLTVRYGV